MCLLIANIMCLSREYRACCMLVVVSVMPTAEFSAYTTPKRGRKRKNFDEIPAQLTADLAKRRSTRVSVDVVTSRTTVWVKKIPPEHLWQFFQNGWEFFNQILRAYYAFVTMLDYRFLFNYLQLWRSYATLSVTTQFKSCPRCPPSAETHAGIFWHFSQTIRNF